MPRYFSEAEQRVTFRPEGFPRWRTDIFVHAPDFANEAEFEGKVTVEIDGAGDQLLYKLIALDMCGTGTLPTLYGYLTAEAVSLLKERDGRWELIAW